jgi:hypothetical protein
VSILWSGPTASHTLQLYLPTYHIRDASELPHGEHLVLHCGGQSPFQRVLGPEDPSSNGVFKIRRDRNAGASALEKLQALAAQHEAAAKHEGQD